MDQCEGMEPHGSKEQSCAIYDKLPIVAENLPAYGVDRSFRSIVAAPALDRRAASRQTVVSVARLLAELPAAP